MNTMLFAERFQALRLEMCAGYDVIRQQVDDKAAAIVAAQKADFKAISAHIFVSDFDITTETLLTDIATNNKHAATSLAELRLRWKEDSATVASAITEIVCGHPELRNDKTKKIIRAALRQDKHIDAENPKTPVAAPKLKVATGAPIKIRATTLAGIGAPVKEEINLGDTERPQLAKVYEIGNPWGFNPIYDRHITMLVVDGQLVDVGLPNPYAVNRHYTHSKGASFGSKTKAMNHRRYDAQKWNKRFAQWLSGIQGTYGRTLDMLAAMLIQGKQVILVSHEVSGHSKEVAQEVVRRATTGIDPELVKIAPAWKGQTAIGISADHWLDDEEEPRPVRTRNGRIFRPSADVRWFTWSKLAKIDDKPAYIVEITDGWATAIDATGKYHEVRLIDTKRWWSFRTLPGGKQLPYTRQYPPNRTEQEPMRKLFGALIKAHWAQYDWIYGKGHEQPVERQSTMKRTIQFGVGNPICAAYNKEGKYIPTSERTTEIGWHYAPARVKMYDPDDTHHGRFASHDESLWEQSQEERFAQAMGMSDNEDDWAAELARNGETDIWGAIEIANIAEPENVVRIKKDKSTLYDDALNYVLSRTRAQWLAKELERNTAERVRVEAAYIEGRMTEQDLADIAHNNGYRDVVKTNTKTGHRYLHTATDQYFGNPAVLTHINDRQVLPWEAFRHSGAIARSYPVKPDPEPKPARRPTEPNAKPMPMWLQALAAELAPIDELCASIAQNGACEFPLILPLVLAILPDLMQKIAFWSYIGPMLEAKIAERDAQDKRWHDNWKLTVAKYHNAKNFMPEDEAEHTATPDTTTAIDALCAAIEQAIPIPATISTKPTTGIRHYWA